MKNNIRVERAIVRISQQQLADAIGVSRQTINAIETGKFVPSTLLALKIARYFSKSVDDIFSLEEGD
ncbi:MAG: helix-turn-helix transcriptional regulator [Bacteroidaceae bacterium]|nr:helix-turn-helix transcriptional regulator [Bacteroidaceae bacterium]